MLAALQRSLRHLRETRRPAFGERRESFCIIVRPENLRQRGAFNLETGREWQLDALVDEPLDRRQAGADRLPSVVANSARVRASSPSGATTSFTSPMPSAYSRGHRLAVSIMCNARLTPMRRGSRCVPPAPGNAPTRLSVSPSVMPDRRKAEVAAERELEPAAERQAVQHGNGDELRTRRRRRSPRGSRRCGRAARRGPCPCAP